MSSKPTSRNYYQENIISDFFYTWVDPIIQLGNTKPFTQDMHFGLSESDQAEFHLNSFQAYWNRYSRNPKNSPLLKSLFKSNQRVFLLSSIYVSIQELLKYSTPLILKSMIACIQDAESNHFYGLSLLILLIFARLVNTIVAGQKNKYFILFDNAIQNNIITMIMAKSLNFSLLRSKKYSTGNLITHVQVDSRKIGEFSYVIPSMLIFPFQMLIGFYLMYSLVGWAFIPGMLTLVVLGFLNYAISKRFFIVEKTLIADKDKRVKATTEILGGIKYIKMAGLEEFFLNKAREVEIESFRGAFSAKSVMIFSLWIAPTFVIASIFLTYLMLGKIINSEIIFPLIAIVGVIQAPMRQLPQYLSFVVKTMVSVNRIESFLLEEPLDIERIRSLPANQSLSAVKITDSTFTWGTTEGGSEKPFQLSNLNLEIPRKRFVAIIGDVGSGKSSIFYSILGEMFHYKTKNAELVIAGDLALAGENSWILNKTLKNNILFGKEINQEKYQDVLKCTCLEQDVELLPKGDQTEIGERGINLSGGQKARVSLARACYQDADIYLLDDPLSALDSHVGKKVLENCLLGFLKEKTRILVTHKLECLPMVDYIYLMSNGKIVQEGTYDVLKNSKEFKDLERKSHPQEKKEESGKDTKSKGIEEIFKAIEIKPDSSDEEESASSPIKSSEKSPLTPKTEAGKEDLIIKEDNDQGELNIETLKLLAWQIGGKKRIIYIVLSYCAFSITMTMSNLWLSRWGESNATGAENYPYFIGYVVIGVIFGLSTLLRTGVLLHSTIYNSTALHNKMFLSILRAPTNTFFDRVPVGRILNRLTGDLTVVDEGLFGATNGVLTEVFALFGDFITSFLLGAPWMFPLTVLFLYMSWRVQRKFLQVKREVTRLEQITRSPIISLFAECLNGLTVIRAYSKEQWFIKQFTLLCDEYNKNKCLKTALAYWFQMRVALRSLIVTFFTLLPLLLFVDKSKIDKGTIGILTSSLPFIDQFVFALLNSESELESKLISLERCNKFTQITPEREAKNNSVAVTKEWPEKGSIRFSNYAVKYRANHPRVLKSISVDIKGNEKIGIVGRTGSGKSTIMLTLLRILEAHKGKIEIDGVDISQVGLYNLRQKITIIPQDPMLISGTLRDNIDLLGQYSDKEIWEALEKSCMKQKFESDNGLKTMIKEGGSNLSAGEKQLLCICRAILAKNRIILIDEATSNIDVKTEELILDTIQKQFHDCTVLTIAHRLKTVINSDKILVLDKGHVVEFDPPQKLLNNEKSYFKQLWDYYLLHSKN